MPDIGVSDNLKGMATRIAQAMTDAASAKEDAATAQANADTAKVNAATAKANADAANVAVAVAQAAATAAQTQASYFLNKIQRVAVSTPALTLLASSQDVTVTWPVPFADSNYSVVPTVWVTAGTLGKFTAQPKAGSQTATGCVVTVASLGIAIASGQTLDVLAIHP